MFEVCDIFIYTEEKKKEKKVSCLFGFDHFEEKKKEQQLKQTIQQHKSQYRPMQTFFFGTIQHYYSLTTHLPSFHWCDIKFKMYTFFWTNIIKNFTRPVKKIICVK